MKEKPLKRCSECDKPIRNYNKSGLCRICWYKKRYWEKKKFKNKYWDKKWTNKLNAFTSKEIKKSNGWKIIIRKRIKTDWWKT